MNLYHHVMNLITVMPDKGNCLMTEKKNKIVGWWRATLEDDQKLRVDDRSPAYAFFMIVAVFPFGTEGLPSLYDFFSAIAGENYFDEFCASFAYMMLMCYGSAMNLGVAVDNRELRKFMKNEKHLASALGKVSHKNIMSTQNGSILIAMAIKLSFFIDCLQAFEMEEFVQENKNGYRKRDLALRKNKGPTSGSEASSAPPLTDTEYLAYFMRIFYSPKMWQTAVYTNMDALLYLSTMAWFTPGMTKNGKQKVCQEPPTMDSKAKEQRFKTYVERAFDFRSWRYSDEVKSFGENVAQILQMRMTYFGSFVAEGTTSDRFDE